MSESESRVITDVDYDKAGKQFTYLSVPSDTNASAYGLVPIPIVVLKNGNGPTIALIAGVHGDEYEGQIILSKLGRDLDPARIQGRIIILPALNLPAVLAAQRLSPVDGLNLNRAYPGDRNGSLTQIISHYVASTILPMLDIHIDLHSGGKTLEYLPCVNMNEVHDDSIQRTGLQVRTRTALEVFGAPYALINRDLDAAGHPSHLYERMGILSLGTELAGAGVISPHALRIGERGVRNLLAHFGLVEGHVVSPEEDGDPPTQIVEIVDLKCYEMASDAGIYEPLIVLGGCAEVGQPLGQIHFPTRPDRSPEVVYTRRQGMLLCKRGPGWVERGDTVAIIAKIIR